MDTAILARVEDFCIREGLLQPGASQHLAAAVSGGADSMALLLLLRQLQPRFGYTLSACHVNHGLRGQSADRDEAFVRAECARLGVPLRVFHAAELASPPAHAGEDWARRLRYTAFAQLQGQGIDAIATAHTANDQAETLLLRLARGTGLHGAGGIRPRRGCYLRPLLCLSRAETEAVCRAAGQPWVTDETNDTDAYARNRLRHNALPALESTNAVQCRIWRGSVKRPRGQMSTLPLRLQGFWRRHACPAQKLHGSWRPCRRQTPCCWKLRCTVLWLRCGMQRKNMCSFCVPWCGRAAVQYS